MKNINKSPFTFFTCLNYFNIVNVLTLVNVAISIDVREDVKSHPGWRLLDRGEDCGLSSSDRIIGGVKAHLGQYPWLARLGYTIHPNLLNISLPIYTCAGTIISDLYVLTAAHCCPPHMEGLPEDVSSFLVTARLGEYDVRKNPDCRQGVCAPPVQDIGVQEYVVHPGYGSARQNDVCLVRLQTQVQFTKYVHPICLPVHGWFLNNSFKHHVMEVAGWGVSDLEKMAYSNVLLTLKIAVVPNKKCVIAFSNRATITWKQLCAGAVVGQDSCMGDSGGPLMTPLAMDGPPRYYLVGVVSFGEEDCGSKAVPGVYARVSEYLTWILDHVKK